MSSTPHATSNTSPWRLLANLPREQRDTVFVLLVVAVVLAPQAAYQPGWAVGMATGVLLWRLWQAWHAMPLPPRWITHVLLTVTLVGTASSFQTLLGAQAGVTLVLLLLVLKTLEMRARRDSMVVFFLGFFTLSTMFMHSQSLPTAVGMLLGLWGLLAALVNAHMPVGRPPLALSLHTAGRLLLWGMPWMVLLFMVTPRLPPLWGHPSESNRAKTGLSDNMQVGNIAQLAQDHSVAMRLRFLDSQQPQPSASTLYFRGPTLSQFDGLRWTAPSTRWPGVSRTDTAAEAHGVGLALAYEITLEPHGQRWLMTLDATLQAPALPQHTSFAVAPLQWSVARPVQDVLRYTAQAHLNYRLGRELPPAEQTRQTQLPTTSDPRTLAWGAQLQAAHAGNAAAIVATALHQLRNGGYRYTLEPQPVQQDTADDFWFGQKAGFCEHIASAFAVLMRAANVPARIVTGYQGGERNMVDGLWTIRQSNAHAWTEVWLPGDGWTRIDPTASVHPLRISNQERLQAPAGILGTAMDMVVGNQHLLRLRATWEALQHHWNHWVLSYSSRQQMGVWHWLQQQWQTRGHWLLVLPVALTLGIWAWRRRRATPDPWQQLLEHARRRMHHHGIPTAPYMGTRALARAAIAQWGVRATALHLWLERMERMRYGRADSGTPSLRALRKEFRSLHWPQARSP